MGATFSRRNERSPRRLGSSRMLLISKRDINVVWFGILTMPLTLTGLADSSVAGGNDPRLARRVLSVAMFGGAAIGALLLSYGLALPLAIASAVVLGATAAYRDIPASENR
jgi:hypothetical protein